MVLLTVRKAKTATASGLQGTGEFLSRQEKYVYLMICLICASITMIATDLGVTVLNGLMRALTLNHGRMAFFIPFFLIAVIAINAATLWHAYRENGFDDKLYGYGALMRDH